MIDYAYNQVVLLLLSPEYLTLNEEFYSPNKTLEAYNVKKVLMQNEQLRSLLEDRKFVGIDVEFTNACIKLKPLPNSNEYL